MTNQRQPARPLRDPKRPGDGFIPRQDWDRAPWNRWTFQNVREMVQTTPVRRGDGAAASMPRAEADIRRIAVDIEGRQTTIGEFLDEDFTDGFLVLHRGSIVAEHYSNGMTPRSLHLSQSVAKSITGSVAGILVDRGLIDPAAPLTKYLPELQRTAYRGATVRHLLDMTSGVSFDETYTATNSHMAKLDAAAGWKERPNADWPATVWELILSLGVQERAHGARFEYRSIETDVLAFALQRVSGLHLAELVSRELWAPMEAEEDACFTVDPAGYALADGGFNATLRDYGRFAALLVNAGVTAGGRQVVPTGWIEDARCGDPELFQGVYREVLPQGAYRNQFWVEDGTRRALIARGVFGQLIYADPEAEFCAVKLSSWPDFLNGKRSRAALTVVRAIRAELTTGG